MKRFVIAGSGLVAGVVALGVFLAGPPTLELSLPIYGDNIWEKFSDGYTSEDYDELAKFDFTIMGHETLIGERHIGLVDSVRARNPDWIYMVYINIFGCRNGHEDDGGYYGEFFDLMDRNDYWLRDYKGNVVHGPCTNQAIPDCSVRFLNCGAEGMADSLAWFFSKYIRSKDNLRHHTGVFMDWINLPWPQWPAWTDVGDLDFNRNGIPSRDDPGDFEQEKKYPAQIAEAFRKAFDDEPTFLLMPNGNVHYYNDNEYAGLFDGGMYELMNLYYPKTQDQWEKAVVHSEAFDNSRVNPPLLMFQGGENDSIGYPTEALASIANGACNFQFRKMGRRISLGKRVTDPVWSGDTVSAVFVSGGEQLIARAVSDPFIWPYLITSFDGADTLSRGGGWTAQVPPSDLEEVLIEYEKYLSDSYGQPVNLDSITKWAETSSAITEICK